MTSSQVEKIEDVWMRALIRFAVYYPTGAPLYFKKPYVLLRASPGRVQEGLIGPLQADAAHHAPSRVDAKPRDQLR